MNGPFDGTTAARVLAGYSKWPAPTITAHVMAGNDLGVVPGDFIVGDTHPHGGYAISSTVGAFPWYWAMSNSGTLHQGSNVFDVASQAGLPWAWNERAI